MFENPVITGFSLFEVAVHRKPRIPKYRLHRPSGKAVVTLNGKDFYLGEFNTPDSKIEYERVVAEWLGRHQTGQAITDPSGLSVAEIMVAYLEHINSYYKDAAGAPTREVQNVKLALRPLHRLYGRNPAKDFGPAAIKAVRQQMIESNLCRGVINQRISIIKRMFKWASSEELVPPATFHGLSCVDGLRRGRSIARETEPDKAIGDREVDLMLSFVTDRECHGQASKANRDAQR
jgi:hypothetical protein